LFVEKLHCLNVAVKNFSFQFFLSGSLDGKLRLWNIPDKKVALWNEVDGPTKLITTANFIQV
jgi:WD40 repeat protein